LATVIPVDILSTGYINENISGCRELAAITRPVALPIKRFFLSPET